MPKRKRLLQRMLKTRHYSKIIDTKQIEQYEDI